MDLYDKYSGVIELRNKDFITKKKISNKEFKNKHGLIVFYAPWCGHCQNMVELWSDIAIQFKHQFPVGAINCEKEQLLCNKMNIKYYPTIKYVSKNGLLYDYNDPITKDNFIYFICSRL